MSKIAFVVSPDFQVSETGVSLKELQAAVDGLIQPIDLSESMTMWVNEEFLFRAPAPNVFATAWFATVGGEYDIHGSVVFTGGLNDDGETLGLSEEQLETLRDAMRYTKQIFA